MAKWKPRGAEYRLKKMRPITKEESRRIREMNAGGAKSVDIEAALRVTYRQVAAVRACVAQGK